MTATERNDLDRLFVRRTREDWLMDAIEVMRPWFTEVEMPLPERVHVSVGFGYGAKRESKNILGQAWATWKSADKVNHVFISPELADAARVLDVLLHELIHVGDDLVSGHRGRFAEVGVRLGLTGSMTATKAGPELRDRLELLAIELGPYPHGALKVAAPVPTLVGPSGEPIPGPRGSSGPRKQTARLIKATCGQCGYTIRVTRKWLDVGLPTCPCGGTIGPVE